MMLQLKQEVQMLHKFDDKEPIDLKANWQLTYCSDCKALRNIAPLSIRYVRVKSPMEVHHIWYLEAP